MLRVDKASVYFAARDGRPIHALDSVSLEIPDGGFVVALGTSGCGKSTLLNAMAGFLPLSSGSIMLNERAVDGPGAERGVVFQKDTLLPWKTVAENVALGLKFAGVGRKERRERARDLLRLVDLQEFAEAAPYEAIIVSAAALEVPPALVTQLAEGGRMILPVGDADYQQLQLIRKENGQPRIALRELCRFVPLVSGESHKRVP